MSLRGLENFKRKISQVSNFAADRFGLSHLLSGASIPDHLLVKPVDCWPGDADKGAHICAGSFLLGDDELCLRRHSWHPVGVGRKWLKNLHSFNWLRDLRAVGSEEARVAAQGYILHWIFENKDRHDYGWAPEVMGVRLSMWAAHFDFFSAGADEEFYDYFFASFARQSRVLHKQICQCEKGVPRLEAIRGLLYAGMALEGREDYILCALDMLDAELKEQILPDGGHVSRSPHALLESLMICLDIRMALMAGGLPPQEMLQYAIDRMGPALRFFTYGDKNLPVMQGAQEGNVAHIDMALAQTEMRGKVTNSLSKTGFERIAQGRSLLMFDAGISPPAPHDRAAHAAPLSFEFAYGKERVFVSCGSHPASEDWAESLRSSAAHNTVTVENRNCCEIKKDGSFGRKVLKPQVKRSETKQFSLIEASHDGYYSLNGLTHERRLFLCEQGHDLRGEDVVRSMFHQPECLQFAVRFHLHPRVLVSLVQDGEEALLRLSSGVGWRFFHDGGRLALENSVYIGQGSQPRKTKQLVIYGETAAQVTSIKWALQREGL